MTESGVSTTLYFGPWYRRSPFFDATMRHGCKAFDIYNHMYLPAEYDDPIKEYWHLLNQVTIWDVSVERVVEVQGPDAKAFSNMITCRDLTRCEIGQGKYAPIIAEDGGIINDPVMLRVDADRFWFCLADSDAGLWARALTRCTDLDVKVSEPPVFPVQVQGPRSKDVIDALFADRLPPLKYYWCARADLDDIPVVVSRTGWTAEHGYEIYLCDPDRGDDMWERVMEAGRPFDIRPIAPCEPRRIEAGIFNYGSDMTVQNNPFEIMGMERLVEEQDADYIGKDALERVRRQGVTRRLVGIGMDGGPFEYEVGRMWPVSVGEEEVGHTTSMVWSPRLERNIGYVWLPVELSAPGTALSVAMSERSVTGRTASIPFIDPRKRTPAA